jgi:glutaredoxin
LAKEEMFGVAYHPKFGLAMSRMSQGDLKKTLIRQIRTAEFIMFTETTCEDSSRAKELLEGKEIGCLCIDVDLMKTPNFAKNLLMDFSGHREIPQIFIKGKYFGGLKELSKTLKNGKLAKYLDKKGISHKLTS